MRAAVVGLGKLGTPMLACLASKGYTVIGADVNAQAVRLINEGLSPVIEPGLGELLEKARGRISATSNIAEAVLRSDVTFIVVPTPSDAEGAFSLEYVLAAATDVGTALRTKESYHLVVLTSTVLPGSTADHVLPRLEEVSGKTCGRDFGLCYSPEFIALGSVIRDFLNPDFILIGESDKHAGNVLAHLYRQLCDGCPPIARMNLVNAELAKLAVNTFVTTKVSYANMLAELCERLDGGNVDHVTAAIGLDSRIGPKYLKGAVGYGGPCFPRDNIALSVLARRHGVPAMLPEATDTVNRRQVPRLVELIRSHRTANDRVGILGLAYKPDTNVVERSPGLELANALHQENIPLVIYDPMFSDDSQLQLNGESTIASSLSECAQSADVLVIMTPDRAFLELQPELLMRPDSPRVVIDCWRLLSPELLTPGCQYIALGQSQTPVQRGLRPRKGNTAASI